MKKTLRILSLVLAALLMLTACGKVETPPAGTGDADTVGEPGHDLGPVPPARGRTPDPPRREREAARARRGSSS